MLRAKEPTTLKHTVLFGNTFRPLFEPIDGLVLPPVMQVAVLVELPALVVEGVGQLVPHHDAHTAIVETVGKRRVVKGTLQDASGKYHLVLRRRVIGVDRRRCHT